jgi:fucose permease
VGTWPVLTGGVAGVAGGALLVTLPGPAWPAVTGLVVMGFAAASVFPLLTLTTADRVGGTHADFTVGVQMAASALGAAAIPALIGALIGTFGPAALAPSLMVLALTMGVIYRRLRPTPPPAPEPT